MKKNSQERSRSEEGPRQSSQFTESFLSPRPSFSSATTTTASKDKDKTDGDASASPTAQSPHTEAAAIILQRGEDQEGLLFHSEEAAEQKEGSMEQQMRYIEQQMRYMELLLDQSSYDRNVLEEYEMEAEERIDQLLFMLQMPRPEDEEYILAMEQERRRVIVHEQLLDWTALCLNLLVACPGEDSGDEREESQKIMKNSTCSAVEEEIIFLVGTRRNTTRSSSRSSRSGQMEQGLRDLLEQHLHPHRLDNTSSCENRNGGRTSPSLLNDHTVDVTCDAADNNDDDVVVTKTDEEVEQHIQFFSSSLTAGQSSLQMMSASAVSRPSTSSSPECSTALDDDDDHHQKKKPMRPVQINSILQPTMNNNEMSEKNDSGRILLLECQPPPSSSFSSAPPTKRNFVQAKHFDEHYEEEEEGQAIEEKGRRTVSAESQPVKTILHSEKIGNDDDDDDDSFLKKRVVVDKASPKPHHRLFEEVYKYLPAAVEVKKSFKEKPTLKSLLGFILLLLGVTTAMFTIGAFLAATLTAAAITAFVLLVSIFFIGLVSTPIVAFFTIMAIAAVTTISIGVIVFGVIIFSICTTIGIVIAGTILTSVSMAATAITIGAISVALIFVVIHHCIYLALQWKENFLHIKNLLKEWVWEWGNKLFYTRWNIASLFSQVKKKVTPKCFWKSKQSSRESSAM